MGCNNATPTTVRRAATPTASPSAADKSGGVVTGTFSVPAQLVGQYAGVIPAGAGNVVPVGGGNVIAAGSGNLLGSTRHLLALNQTAVGGAKVYLADAGGNAIPGLPSAKTDSSGHYTIANVPAGYDFVVAASVSTTDGKTATYQTLVKSSSLGATANIDASSTMVSAAVLQSQQGSDLGDFNAATFETARQTTDAHLSDSALPDFTSRQDVTAKVDALASTVTELKGQIDTLQQDIKDIKQSLAQLEQQLAQESAQASGTTTASDTTQTSGTTSSGGTGGTWQRPANCPPPVPPGAPPPPGYPPACLGPGR